MRFGYHMFPRLAAAIIYSQLINSTTPKRQDIHEVEGILVLFARHLMFFWDEFAVQCMDVITQVCIPAFLKTICSVNVAIPLFLLARIHRWREQCWSPATELWAMTGSVDVRNWTEKLKATNNGQSFEPVWNNHCGPRLVICVYRTRLGWTLWLI